MDYKKEIENLAATTNLVVLIELQPLSDRYTQILLTQDVFKKVSDIVWHAMPDSKETPDGKTITVHPMEPIKIPDMSCSYSRGFIHKLTRAAK